MTIAREQISILQVAEGYFGSQVLFTLNELGVCTALSSQPRDARTLAAEIEVDADALERVLRGGVALGLLRVEAGRFANSPRAERTLVEGSEGYLGNWLRLMSRWSRNWTRLTEAVIKGGGIGSDGHLGADPVATRDFVLAMDDYARVRGKEVVDHVDLDGVQTLLDLGGGPGTYSALFARRWPALSSTVFDLPDVVDIAGDIIRALGVADRVVTQAGDYREDPFGGPYGAVFISGTLHQEDPETCRMILKKAFDALAPGGLLVIQQMFLDDDKLGPRWPVMQSISLLLLNGKGRAYSAEEIIDLVRQASFVDIVHRKMSMLNVNSLVLARRPG